MNMANREESSDNPIKYKKLVLRVSIDCQGCRKRVNKIITKFPGIQEIDINIKQQTVTVTGDIDAVVLLKKLGRSGRQVELFPDPVALKQPDKSKAKEKLPKLDTNEERCRSRTTVGCNNIAGNMPQPQPQVKSPAPQQPAINIQTTGGDSADGSVKVGEKNDGISESENSGQAKESKPEGKNSTADGETPITVEKKDGDGENLTNEKVESGNGGKKKKKGGQNVNKVRGESSSLTDPTTNHGVDPPKYSFPTNHVLPRVHDYYVIQSDMYTSAPVYTASYNTSHAISSTTRSYYAELPPDSYVYAYSGAVREPTPSDVMEYPRQPLDSLEMFSDENPNGCSIM